LPIAAGGSLKVMAGRFIRMQVKARRAERNLLLEEARMRLKAKGRLALKALKSLFSRGNPDDPYALVTAPRKPRLPGRAGAVAVDPQDC
jgi:hypothetical protein